MSSFKAVVKEVLSPEGEVVSRKLVWVASEDKKKVVPDNSNLEIKSTDQRVDGEGNGPDEVVCNRNSNSPAKAATDDDASVPPKKRWMYRHFYTCERCKFRGCFCQGKHIDNNK